MDKKKKNEKLFLINKGIKKVILVNNINNKNLLVLQDFPLAIGKVIYLIAEGTDEAYVLPYYLIENITWFKEILLTLTKKAYKVSDTECLLYETPLDNLIIVIKPPFPFKLKDNICYLLNYNIENKSKEFEENLKYFSMSKSKKIKTEELNFDTITNKMFR